MTNQLDNYQNRMAQIFTGASFAPESDKTIIAALDDSLITGPGLRESSLLYYPDAMLKGITDVASAALAFTGRFDNFSGTWPENLARITNVTASVEGPHHLDKKLIVPSEMAVQAAERVGASAISFHFNHGSETESEQMVALGSLGEACRQAKMPLLVHAYPRTLKRHPLMPWRKTEYHYREHADEHTSIEEYTRLVLHGTAIAIDLGGGIIKVPYTGDTDSMGQVAEFAHNNNVKVVVAGGPLATVPRFLDKIKSAMDSGVDGIAVGRSYFGRRLGPAHERERYAKQLLTAMAEVVHNGTSPDAAAAKANLDTTA